MMKKLVLLGAVAILGLTSCKRDYTCDCDGYEYTLLDFSKKEAKKQCEGPRGYGEIADEDGDHSYDPFEDCELSKFKD